MRIPDRVRQNGLPFWTTAGGPQGERHARVNPDRASSTSPAFFQTQVWFFFKPMMGRARIPDRVRQNGPPFWTAAGGPQGERHARVNPDRASSTSPAFFQTQVWGFCF
ncbi:hypothetical protein [Dickeya dadantii]|uniref:hypothetical protein n=1 Tax=Dickeya dadantii TaxID=204038 RepID=UPI003019F5D9